MGDDMATRSTRWNITTEDPRTPEDRSSTAVVTVTWNGVTLTSTLTVVLTAGDDGLSVVVYGDMNEPSLWETWATWGEGACPE